MKYSVDISDEAYITIEVEAASPKEAEEIALARYYSEIIELQEWEVTAHAHKTANHKENDNE